MIPVLNKRNGRGRRGGRGEKEGEEAKQRKMSERIVKRITGDSHNKKHSSNTHRMIMKILESCSDDCVDPRKTNRSEMERQRT
jgi:hypothetical protein